MVQTLFGLNIAPLEGAFWSLYVEFKFYIIAGLLYFFIGRLRLILALFLMSSLAHFSQFITAQNHHSIFDALSKVTYALSLQHFGWFAGAAAYCYLKTNDNRWLLCSIFLIVYSAIFLTIGNFNAAIYTVLIGTIFIIPLTSNWLEKFLENRVIQFFGYISYPLYLLHENIMIASIIKIGKFDLTIPQVIFPLFPLIALSVVSFFITKHLEPIGKKILLKFYSPNSARDEKSGKVSP